MRRGRMGTVKRRRILVIAGLVFVGAVIAVVVWPGEREPEYQGRKLSEWLEIYQRAQPVTTEETEAIGAFDKSVRQLFRRA